ncbi:MAG TPA: TetR/AcrR family transcriptional regulator [Rhizobiales bacterium]|nr:TetR/AcrR family transcriptional regulator [Hyphomicrobiales bacterium]
MSRSINPGRPSKAAQSLTKQGILHTALPLVQEYGIEAISFRLLAERLGVTAMAVKYHAGSRKELLAGLVDMAFANTLVRTEASEPTDRVRIILQTYCARALINANLLRAVLEDTSLMCEEMHTITNLLRAEAQALGEQDDVLVFLLVDYTHGWVLSASCGEDNPLTMTDYLSGLDWILKRA